LTAAVSVAALRQLLSEGFMGSERALGEYLKQRLLELSESTA